VWERLSTQQSASTTISAGGRFKGARVDARQGWQRRRNLWIEFAQRNADTQVEAQEFAVTVGTLMGI
jgi:hypothetical protein